MTGSPTSTSATTAAATSSSLSAGSTSLSAPMCAPESSSSGPSEPGESTGIDGCVVRRTSTNANGGVSSAEISGKKACWRQSKSFKITPPTNMSLEDIDSPRFQEILRITNGQSKKSPYAKSLSLQHGYKVVHDQLEDVKLMIKEKFNEAKEEVNGELAIFTGELGTTLKQTQESHPEWKKDLEDLLLVAHQSARMSSEEFWSECEGIVLKLDQHRQKLPLGVVKQAHTRLLFILTRCTRLVQCH